jgi:hypothetical protein
MTTLERVRLVGAGVDRVDGPRKVTGSAPYPNDFSFPNLAHAALVRSTIAAGASARCPSASTSSSDRDADTPGPSLEEPNASGPRGALPQSLASLSVASCPALVVRCRKSAMSWSWLSV